MIGTPGGNRMEMPDTRNDQARAHSLARASAEEKICKHEGGVLPKIQDILNPS
jgi:hypothetical protein